jgi:hypothetical protein
VALPAAAVEAVRGEALQEEGGHGGLAVGSAGPAAARAESEGVGLAMALVERVQARPEAGRPRRHPPHRLLAEVAARVPRQKEAEERPRRLRLPPHRRRPRRQHRRRQRRRQRRLRALARVQAQAPPEEEPPLLPPPPLPPPLPGLLLAAPLPQPTALSGRPIAGSHTLRTIVDPLRCAGPRTQALPIQPTPPPQ